ncbi:phospho-sugar mutase [Angelakisella massiliensis]|uniref:phospho-sugar mutase n=1 Tax=Angelakisella massiliensis TaxID=1871018 RepID=UPI0008F82CCD|nr:phospho-sugar mutase [Angelakisella massiliensis]
MEIMQQYENWSSRALEDPALNKELAEIQGKPEEIKDRFYCDLEFGTAGLRGVLGAGTNRMNIYTVRRATQGLADYLLTVKKTPSVAIAYDSRINSTLFAQESAAVLAANGVKAYIYRELMPTPALSYAVRELHCDAGINITASHNPSKYNGYKAYDETGCQITGEIASAVMSNILKTDIFDGVRHVPFQQGLDSGMIQYIDEELVQRYIGRVLEEQVNPGLCKDAGLKLVYTPLNGAGRRCVLTALERIGITDVTVVKEQEMPDGNFPTCPYPNPEILQAMQLGLDLVEKLGADLLLATDPDCDRVGTAVLQDGKPRLITGNEMGVLLMDYIARSRIANGTMPKNPVVVKSIVSTTMTEAVAKEYGIEVRAVLTGFKYIGEQIMRLEQAGEEDRFLLGFEESYGYLSGGYVRDKDAVDGSLLICEMAAWYKKQGKHLGQALDEMYAKYGRYLNKVDSYTFEGSDGMAKMSGILETLRAGHPTQIAGIPVSYTADYRTSRRVENGVETQIDLPSANVLEYGLGEAGSLIVRPSGTEPKLKLYYSLKAATLEEAQDLLAKVKAAAEELLGL